MRYNALLHGTPKAWDIQRKQHKGGGGGTSTSTTTQNIPDELKPLATAYTNKAMALGDTPYQAYTGQGVAGMTAPQYAGMGMTMDRAMNGSQTINNAEGQLNDIISGGNTNPYLDAMYNRAAGQTANAVNGQFAQGGRYGSGAHTGVLADSLGGMASQMYGQAYDQDRARQMQGIGMAQQFGNQAYQDAGQMMNVGQMLQDQNQAGLDWNYGQFQDEQNDPYKKLASMAGVFGSNLGGSSTTTQSGGGGK